MTNKHVLAMPPSSYTHLEFVNALYTLSDPYISCSLAPRVREMYDSLSAVDEPSQDLYSDDRVEIALSNWEQLVDQLIDCLRDCAQNLQSGLSKKKVDMMLVKIKEAIDTYTHFDPMTG